MGIGCCLDFGKYFILLVPFEIDEKRVGFTAVEFFVSFYSFVTFLLISNIVLTLSFYSKVTKEGGFTVVEPYASDDIGEGSVLFLPANKE